MKKTALIMAGGRGERFWPRSRKSLPKQFLSLTNDGKTMIQLTVERILPLVDMEDIYIATNKDYKNL
ncbi:MAG: sugar phosphate nucleotidyltransferase, partial [Lachnospiraceae bacterium]|nr:sugar phosphate nucleotidyltransferase [Lachnospiraceae bacterium]